MIDKFREFISQITGISTPVVGVQWNPSQTERNIIYEFWINLAERRILSEELCDVPCEKMMTSIDTILSNIRMALNELGPDSEVRPLFEEMRIACQKFQKYLEEYFLQNHENDEVICRTEFRDAISALRNTFKNNIESLNKSFKLNIEVDKSINEEVPGISENA
jgi:hypothetical protein